MNYLLKATLLLHDLEKTSTEALADGFNYVKHNQSIVQRNSSARRSKSLLHVQALDGALRRVLQYSSVKLLRENVDAGSHNGEELFALRISVSKKLNTQSVLLSNDRCDCFYKLDFWMRAFVIKLCVVQRWFMHLDAPQADPNLLETIVSVAFYVCKVLTPIESHAYAVESGKKLGALG